MKYFLGMLLIAVSTPSFAEDIVKCNVSDGIYTLTIAKGTDAAGKNTATMVTNGDATMRKLAVNTFSVAPNFAYNGYLGHFPNGENNFDLAQTRVDVRDGITGRITATYTYSLDVILTDPASGNTFLKHFGPEAGDDGTITCSLFTFD
jgi:hypothetical protein